jgi:hypothetical protein
MTHMQQPGSRPPDRAGWTWNPMWGWGVLAGIVVLVIALVFISGEGTQTTDTTPPTTTGQGTGTPPTSGGQGTK